VKGVSNKPGVQPDPFRRDPGAPFDSWEREEYAKARAKGGSLKASATLAGVTPAAVTKWERHPEVKARIRELRDGAETFVGVSTAWVINQLKINVEDAREAGAIKASNEALGMIYKILTEDRNVGHQLARALPPHVTRQELQKRLRESFGDSAPRRRKKALPADASPAIDVEPDAEDTEAAE
jgi:hypothetical protein